MKNTKKVGNKKPAKRLNKLSNAPFYKRILPVIWLDRRWWQRVFILLITLVFGFLFLSWSVAMWYTQKHKNEPLVFGTTFIPTYARYFGLDPQETMDAMINDLNFKHFRLVSYWEEIEKTPGTYDFSELDWQIQKASDAGAQVNLAVGLRQPRWPECHMPDWAKTEPYDVWYPQLKTFMTETVNRYKNNPNVVSFQVENEFFMTVFGDCKDFNRDRLIEEVKLVKELAPDKKIIVTRSNNWGGVPIGEPTPDEYGVAVYKRVWDQNLTFRYFEYPYPSWFYSSLAGFGEIVSGKPLYIHELQTEPWLPPDKGFSMNDINSIPEQNKSLDAKRLGDRFDYAEATGLRTIDTWGGEWWYWRKTKAGDSSLWDMAKQKIKDSQTQRTTY